MHFIEERAKVKAQVTGPQELLVLVVELDNQGKVSKTSKLITG